MKRLLQQLICLAALLNFIVPCTAMEPVTPPLTQPRERWIMMFDDYHMLLYDQKPADLINLSREITIVRDGNDLYIQGIFDKYPNAWMKGTVNGDELEMTNSQYITKDNYRYIYGHWGCARHSFRSGDTDVVSFKETSVMFCNKPYSSQTPQNLAITNNGKTMTARVWNYSLEEYSAVWYDDEPEGTVDFTEGTYSYNNDSNEFPYGGFPEVDYRVNVCFKKIDDSGIGNMTNDDTDDKSAPMYDLQGRRVDPETAGPGIYIRNRKKIML
jgi:hypothetical protein